MGPAVGREGDRACRGETTIWPVPGWLDTELFGLALVLNGVIPCEAPSGRINCSRSSRLVLPLANGRSVQNVKVKKQNQGNKMAKPTKQQNNR